jgi:serine/threonine protein phosphatase 1
MYISTEKYTRLFVISDIHGCLLTLKVLINKLKLQKSDAVFFLGDYIDRGPNSSGVLDYLLNFRKLHKNVFFLRGNHENDILLFEKEYSPEQFTGYVSHRYNSGDLLTSDNKIKDKYRNFFASLPYYFELDNFLLVHAGFDFSKNDFLHNTTAMLQIRNWQCSFEQTKGKRVVFGHTAHKLSQIKEAVSSRNVILPLDNGCVYRYHIFNEGLGHLCCLELNSFELICQENIDKF